MALLCFRGAGLGQEGVCCHSAAQPLPAHAVPAGTCQCLEKAGESKQSISSSSCLSRKPALGLREVGFDGVLGGSFLWDMIVRLGLGDARGVSWSLHCQDAHRPPMTTPHQSLPAAALPPMISAMSSWWSWREDPLGWGWG